MHLPCAEPLSQAVPWQLGCSIDLIRVKHTQVNYRESISRMADIHYIHKKQSGGAGQFADISVRFEPGEPGSGFTFRSEIKGGAVCPCKPSS